MIKYEKEFESKVFITLGKFSEIIKEMGLKKTNNQKIKNIYFDTYNFDIFKNAGVLRARILDNTYTITFKKAIKKNFLTETSQTITEKQFLHYQINHFKDTKFEKIIINLGINPNKINKIGFLLANRFQFEFQNAIIFLDHCIYNNQEDYEIECEAGSGEEAEAKIIEFCHKYNINPNNRSQTKYARFLKTLGDK